MWDFLPVDAFQNREWSRAVPESLNFTDVVILCDSCGYETTGYQMGELIVEHGWRLHSKGQPKMAGHKCTGPNCNRHGQYVVQQTLFTMCGSCEEAYAERRRQAPS